MKRDLAALVLVASLAGACRSQHPVTREEAARAVAAALAQDRPCIGDKAWLFPAKVSREDPFLAETVEALDSLAKAGLVRSAATTDTVSKFALGDGGSYKAAVPATEYTLTEASQRVYKSYEAPGYGRVGAFCFGRWDVEVVNFTESDDAPGKKLLMVNYKRQIADVPAWANVPALAARRTGRGRAQGTDTPPVERMDLAQTDTGWAEAGF